MLQLPNISETKDPVVKKIILAIQTLSDEIGSQNTAIFGEMVNQIQGLRKDVREGFKSQNNLLKNSLDAQTDLLKQIVENTKK